MHDLDTLSGATMRRLDNTYYALLEKSRELRAAVTALQHVAALTAQLRRQFDDETSQLIGNVNNDDDTNNHNNKSTKENSDNDSSGSISGESSRENDGGVAAEALAKALTVGTEADAEAQGQAMVVAQLARRAADLDAQHAEIEKLGARLRAGRDKAAALGTRLERVRGLVDNWEMEEVEWQAKVRSKYFFFIYIPSLVRLFSFENVLFILHFAFVLFS